MSFWSLDNIKKSMGGTWLARPEASGHAPVEVTGLSTDTRTIKPGQVFLALKGENTDGHKYLVQAAAAGASLLIIDQPDAVPAGLERPVAILQVAATGPALMRLAAAYRKTLESTRVIAVGGSNGKTTTVKLIHAVLSRTLRGTASAKSFNNAVGVPLTILSAKKNDQYLVCEVGTNAPGEIAALVPVVEPDIAVITSIGREHLEGLGSLPGVLQEEASLLKGLRPGGLAVLCADAPGLIESATALLGARGGDAARSASARRPTGALGEVGGTMIITFGAAAAADIRVSACEQRFEGLRFCLNDRSWYTMPLLGAHNAANAAAAVAVARRLGVDNAEIEAGLAAAKGPEMRLERSVAAGISFVNDAYNANPESALAALRTFAQVAGGSGFARRVLVLGDMLELGEGAADLHCEVGAAAAAVNADLVVLVGSFSRETAAGLRKAGWPGTIESVKDLERGGDGYAAGLLCPGDIVLLKGSRRIGLERIITAAQRLETAEPRSRVSAGSAALGAQARQ
jgi:UDP-N-acetylmuramoyl-tripeptide--D-alanyl-D-alanine ligase